MEFEIIEKPSAGKPGLMRAKPEKSLEEQLVDACKEVVYRCQSAKGERKTLHDACQYVIHNEFDVAGIAHILLAMEMAKFVKDPGKVYRSDIHMVSVGCKRGWVEAGNAEKPYYQYRSDRDGDSMRIFNHKGIPVCPASEVVEDL